MNIYKYFLRTQLIALTWCISSLATVNINIDNYNYLRDCSEIVGLIREEWSKLFLQPSYDDKMINKMLVKNRPFSIAYQDKQLHIRVLRDEDKIAGFATYYYPAPTVGHIELLAINKQFRSKGLGKKLIEYVTTEMAKQGVKTLQLYVYPTNPEAIKFYTHLGFTVKAHYPGYMLLYKPIKEQSE